MSTPGGSRFGEDIGGLYDYMEVFLEMLCLGNWLWGELSVKKASQVLAHSFCSLIPVGTSVVSKVFSRQGLRAMKDQQFQWPSREDLAPGGISALAMNIARNFMLNCFAEAGPTLVHEGACRTTD